MRRLAATLALVLSMSGAASAEQVFSFDTTPGRLPKNVVPVR
jgi:aminopeptidase N